ncbi:MULTISPECIES: ABC transporter ATP-binding protein [unclassified Halomonas]|uniref:ABC transporter ATP-binding protein n=1 Tax=unclassified Halomonas TaxID=2609666 RepID=UPI00403477C5
MIEIRNLYKRYHNHHGSDWVLKNINLTIPPKVSVGLIGANGAGKSTLLRLIAGMDKPERGEVIRHSKVSWPVGLSGGMQQNMTARQNVKFVARVHGSSSEDVKRVIKHVENFADIGTAFDEPVRTFSSGMRSRVSFGLSLAFDFDVYISDEATAVGDKNFKAKAKAAFREKTGKASLIMVSHSEGILRELCQAGIFINKGEATWFDSIDDAIDAYHKAYGLVESERLKKTRQEVTASRKVFREAKIIYKEAKDSNSVSPKELVELKSDMNAKLRTWRKQKAELKSLQEANDDE